MENLSAKVLALLKGYAEDKKRLALLWREWGNPVTISAHEMLEAMSFSKGTDGVKPSAGHISDKTYQIATQYREMAIQRNQKERQELLDQIERLEQKLRRIEFCVSQLQPEQAAVIRGIYFDGKGQGALIDELHLSGSTIQRYRDKALFAMAGMYTLLQDAGIALEW